AEHGERLPGVHAVADAVDRLGDARPGVEFDVEVLHLEQGSRAVRAGAAAQRLGEHFHHAVPPQRSFGSRASRTASPSMTKVSTHRERNPAGKSSACAPERMYWAWSAIAIPHEMTGERSPMPSSERVASAPM